ncbi:MAG: phage shock protein operon transcriptional activator [Rhodospirillales bacterium]|nr:phage shock protein operon transcriptional activator [Rhodospirillales bacterium]
MAQPISGLSPLIGQSPAFLEVMEQASAVAPLDRPVLVIGERGTGKELIAQRLHYLSGRWARPMVALNCAALAETLIETELFGHEAGAFTGAVRRRVGRFERADGGTLFLDEIASAPLAVQEKILRVVEYGEFERVGAGAVQRCDVRLIAAANVDLPAAAAAGRFRHDLLDRLAFEVLHVPPLRARAGDIPLLADHFARAMASDLGWPGFPGFSAGAGAALLAHPWPGNVRELKNVVERAVFRWRQPRRPVAAVVLDPFASPYASAPTRIQAEPSRAPATMRPPDAAIDLPLSGDLDSAVRAFEAELLRQALAAARYNQRAAAASVGLAYHQFRNRLKKHGLIAGAASPPALNGGAEAERVFPPAS